MMGYSKRKSVTAVTSSDAGSVARYSGGRYGSTPHVPDEFDDLDATEKAAIGAALNRCRALATKIANELRNKSPEQFADKLSWQTFTPPLSVLPMSSAR